MGDITRLLQAARAGDGQALDAVFADLYANLRALAASRLAGERAGLTLSATSLVHEVYLKLIDARHLDLVDRQHFFACAARAMRQIMVDHVRARMAAKRGGAQEPVTLSWAHGLAAPEPELLDVDAALAQLEQIDSRLRQLVEMRLFAGLTLEQLAQLSGRSLRSINRDWQRARALLLAQMA
ncbi:MAG: ECF-type sigma factor [Xanthomonadales bacterium]|nr:ECF-type sigma factor [Xanthomonadales bacterium]